MITFFNRKEVYMGKSELQYAQIRDALKDAAIKISCLLPSTVTTKRVAIGGSRNASYGNNGNRDDFFHIYVHKKDYERAMDVIKKY